MATPSYPAIAQTLRENAWASERDRCRACD